MSTGALITGVGAVTPVGLSYGASCTALRAGISRLREIESHLVPGPLFDAVPVVGGRVPLEWMGGTPEEEEWPGHEHFGVKDPPPPWALVGEGSERLVDLALPAAREAWGAPGSRAVPNRLGIYLGLPETEAAEPLVAAIQADLNLVLTKAIAQPGGRAAGLEVLAAAVGDLASGAVDCALVGGVDSQLRGGVLERLEAAGQLRTGENPGGVIPGEGAAFVVLSPSDGAGATRVFGRVVSTAVMVEPTLASGEPNCGVGLATALQTVRDQIGLTNPPLVVCDLNGDRYRALEWGLATTRAFGSIQGDLEFWHPADCIGDAGAAMGLVNLVWGVHALARGYSPSPQVVVWGASENGVRAAVAVEAGHG